MKLPCRLVYFVLFVLSPPIALAVQPLEMDNAVVLESSDPAVLDQLVITGHNFNNGGDVQLTLGGTPLTVILQEKSRIIAEIPAGVLPGSYVLVAWSGNGSVREDSMDITIGAEGPAGPQGEVGPAGQDGAPGADGAPGQDGAPGADGSSCSAADTIDGALISCTDGTSATVFDGTDGVNGLPGVKGDAGDAGPPGPQGPPGNLALAGLSCSSGTFLIGFSDTGALVCASVDSNGGGTTPPPVGDAEIVFVATAASGGDDTNPGTRSLPLSTIQAGIDRAVQSGLSRVNVAAGTYTSASTIQLANGVSVVGGFDVTDWMQHGNPTVITVSAPIALRAQDIEAKTILDSLVLSSADGQANQSSYGVYVRASNGLEIRNSTITAGTGGAGLDGLSVSSGIAGNTGGAGGNGSPDGPHGSGGSGGSGSCGAGSGGSGGRGALEGSTAAGQSGFNGNSGSGGSSGGIGGSGGATGDCGFGISCRGRAGEAGSNGQGGSAGQNGMSATNGLGTIVAGLWVGQNGSSGSTGRPGSGGGGGGGGGGQIGALINDGGGNGGGGGGAGGCGGEGGSGGFAGGGSFGIFLVDSTGVEIHDNLVTSGGGGMGGSGGAGGTGGTGGAGGPGANNATDEIGAGGAGGNGGTGGRGGQGGGGAGGVSFSIGLSNSTIVESGNQLLFGAGGTGGAAAGNAGIAGANGMIQNF